MFTTSLKKLKKLLRKLGPGFITGAADDDPSGIATYSIAGAQFGYRLNWLSLFLLPMMISIQEMCGRIGLCSGMGLAGVIKKFHSKRLLVFAVSLLLVANTINISADLGIMAASLEMILDLPFLYWLVVVTILTIILEIFVSYKRYSNFLRFMALSLLVYAVTAFLVKQDWLSIARYTLIPHIEFNSIFLMTMVAFIGTTISPYLFFWQATEEVEEEIEDGRFKDFQKRPRMEATKRDILH
ncbi:MAG: divalent metal cation transporter, partial [Candidatus Curtissbacteria bacterium]|nr:divalent metal cation transporter [Candidatus Curtissbacteria bacterium]